MRVRVREVHPRDVHELLPVPLPHRGRAQVGDAGEGEVEVLERRVEPAVRVEGAHLLGLAVGLGLGLGWGLG